MGIGIHLIDTGVRGAEKSLANYLTSIGRSIYEVKSILLTHSHPDHIGGANSIKELSHGRVYACQQEKVWIEDIDVQFRERPIPNFYNLVNKSVDVDRVIGDGGILSLEAGITIKTIDTRGHSQESLSFLWVEENIVFTGDAIPAVGDIPIYVSAEDSLKSLAKLLNIGANQYLSSWDEVFNEQEGKNAINKAFVLLDKIKTTVTNEWEQFPNSSKEEIYTSVCTALNLQHLIENPLFRKSIFSTIDEMR
jgi:glyoxylase-like metal-dependent hydrolase (beta-lactamase superfamily II)